MSGPNRDLPSDALGVLLVLAANQEGKERVLERAHELFAEDPTVIADLRHEVMLLERTVQSLAQKRLADHDTIDRLRRELDRRAAEARTTATCGLHTLTGDLECALSPNHDLPHRGGSPAVEWNETLEYDSREPGHSHARGVECRPEGCTGHPTWADIRARGLVEATIVCGAQVELGDRPSAAPGYPWQPRLECTLPEGHAERHTAPVTW